LPAAIKRLWKTLIGEDAQSMDLALTDFDALEWRSGVGAFGYFHGP